MHAATDRRAVRLIGAVAARIHALQTGAIAAASAALREADPAAIGSARRAFTPMPAPDGSLPHGARGTRVRATADPPPARPLRRTRRRGQGHAVGREACGCISIGGSLVSTSGAGTTRHHPRPGRIVPGRAAAALQHPAANRKPSIGAIQIRHHAYHRIGVQRFRIRAIQAHRIPAPGERVARRVRAVKIQHPFNPPSYCSSGPAPHPPANVSTVRRMHRCPTADDWVG